MPESKHNYGGEITEENASEMGSKSWQATRRRLLREFGFDPDKLDESNEWEITAKSNND